MARILLIVLATTVTAFCMHEKELTEEQLRALTVNGVAATLEEPSTPLLKKEKHQLPNKDMPLLKLHRITRERASMNLLEAAKEKEIFHK